MACINGIIPPPSWLYREHLSKNYPVNTLRLVEMPRGLAKGLSTHVRAVGAVFEGTRKTGLLDPEDNFFVRSLLIPFT